MHESRRDGGLQILPGSVGQGYEALEEKVQVIDK